MSDDGPVTLEDREAAGLPAMLAALLTAAAARPAKAAVLARMAGSVTIDVPDAELSVGLAFRGGRCTVSSRPVPRPTLRLCMDSERLLGLSSVPLLAGLPNVGTPAGRAVVRAVLTGRLRVRGLRHVVLLRQLSTLLNVTDM